MSSKSSSRAALVLGGLTVVGLAAAGYYLFTQHQQQQQQQQTKGKKATGTNSSATSARPASGSATAAEDADDALSSPADDLKQQYEDCIRVAKKLMLGNAFARAADKYSEAIGLATLLPSAHKDVMTLYNNRSAMYEKAGDLDKAMSDIMLVLQADPVHLKARLRRARIFEQQGKGYEALDDYVMSMFIERAKNLPPTTTEKADEVCKQVRVRVCAANLRTQAA